MNFLDITIFLILLLSVINGIKDGFIKTFFFLIGTILGLILATKYNSVFTPVIMKLININSIEAQIIAYVILFVISGLIMKVFYRLLIKSNRILFLWDKIFGGILGLLESMIILSLILIILHSFNFPSESVINNSIFYYSIYNFAPQVFDIIKTIIPGTNSFFEEFYLL
ncbi:MAG TPA: CvpA family protein [Ignavibacteria bacterium]|jgi:uncharacterized membrane protein required for colicin V production